MFNNFFIKVFEISYLFYTPNTAQFGLAIVQVLLATWD